MTWFIMNIIDPVIVISSGDEDDCSNIDVDLDVDLNNEISKGSVSCVISVSSASGSESDSNSAKKNESRRLRPSRKRTKGWRKRNASQGIERKFQKQSYSKEQIIISSSDELSNLSMNEDVVEERLLCTTNFDNTPKRKEADFKILKAGCSKSNKFMNCDWNSKNRNDAFPQYGSHFRSCLFDKTVSLSPKKNIHIEVKEKCSSSIFLKEEIISPCFKNSAPGKENENEISKTRNVPESESISDIETYGGECNSTLSNLTLKFHDLFSDTEINVVNKEPVSRSSFLLKHSSYYGPLYYLERNQRLCLYRTTYFPFNTNLCKNMMSKYHSNLIYSVLDFDSRHVEGLALLDDFSSYYTPVTNLRDIFNDVMLKSEKTRERNFIYSLSLLLLQKIPNLFAMSTDKFKFVLSGVGESELGKDSAGLFTIRMLIHAFEINIFTMNMCDNLKLRHTLTHCLLSLDAGRSNINLILSMISKCISQKAVRKPNKTLMTDNLSGNGKFLWLSSLHHLIHLGLLTTKTNVISSILVIAIDLRSMYFKLRLLPDKIIFLESVENPVLCLFTLLEILERLSVHIPNDQLPSYTDAMQSFCKTIYSSPYSSTKNEELIVLLYFTLRCITACHQECCFESLRTRILRQSIEAVKISNVEKEKLFQSLDDLHCHYIEQSSNLAPETDQFFDFIKCLIDSLID